MSDGTQSSETSVSLGLMNDRRLTPAQLVAGEVYDTPMGCEGPVLIVSVGPKWITFRQHEPRYTGEPVPRWGARRRLLRSGWEGQFFHLLRRDGSDLVTGKRP